MIRSAQTISQKHRRLRPGQSGFSLLEAIVAIAIMAGFGMTIFAWINTNLLTINRIEQRAYKDHLIRSTSEYMQDVDIMSKPNGQTKFMEYDIHWNAVLLEPIKEGRSRTGGLSEFQLGLYDTEVKIFHEGEELVLFNIRLVGYKKVRDYDNVF